MKTFTFHAYHQLLSRIFSFEAIGPFPNITSHISSSHKAKSPLGNIDPTGVVLVFPLSFVLHLFFIKIHLPMDIRVHLYREQLFPIPLQGADAQ